jgi:DNA-directed RNA polymerase specialized sigma24 family protein
MPPPIDPPLTVSLFDDDGSDQEEILKKYEPYIRSLVRKQFPRDMVHPDVLDLAIDEAAEEALVRLWSALQRNCITNVQAYIRPIIRSVIADLRRKHKPTQPLPVDEDGELDQGDVIATVGEGWHDPADEVEREEFVVNSLMQTVDEVLALPPCQQRAVICSLKDRIDNVLLLIETFREHQVDIEQVNWPEEREERQKCRASLTVARKKLRTSLYPHLFCDD